MTRLDDSVTALRALADGLSALLERHPDATVVRSRVGNLSILDAAGKYIGWADVITGEVQMIARERA